LKDGENRETTKFYTRVQKLDKLQVRQSGGKKEKKKKRRGRRMQRDGRTGRRSLYFSESCKNSHVESSDEEDKFGFEPGPMFSLEGFEKYADQFKQEYFALKDQNEISSKSEPSVECIEGEYWRIVQHATEQVEVCMAELSSNAYRQ
jgi:histone demethylase JARID1